MKTIIIVITALLWCNAANARHAHRSHVAEASGCLIPLFCLNQAPERAVLAPHARHSRHMRRQIALGGAGFDQIDRGSSTSAVIVSHPAGCPARLFCGCGAAVRVFGRSVRELWLAANWLRFPRTTPAPGMAAVHPGRHHVMILEASLGGNMWQVYDANSGGHATRIHARSIAGFTIVNPRS